MTVKRTLWSSFVVLILAFVAVKIINFRPACEPAARSTGLVKDTDWIGEIRAMACGDTYTVGGLDIRLVNRTTGEVQVIASGGDVLSYQISSPNSMELVVTLPNRSVASLYPVSGPVKVRFNFTPKFDPLDRGRFLAMHFGDRKLEYNRRWYCDNIFAAAPEYVKKYLDDAYAYSVYGENGPKSYCLR